MPFTLTIMVLTLPFLECWDALIFSGIAQRRGGEGPYCTVRKIMEGLPSLKVPEIGGGEESAEARRWVCTLQFAPLTYFVVSICEILYIFVAFF